MVLLLTVSIGPAVTSSHCDESFLPKCNSSINTSHGGHDLSGQEPPWQTIDYNIDNTPCPRWLMRGEDGECDCRKNYKALKDVIQCKKVGDIIQSYLLTCNCMTLDNSKKNVVVGYCFYQCFSGDPYYCLPENESVLEDFTCGDFNRTGQLCGKCIDGYGLPVYSYDIGCVNCTYYSVTGVLKYIAVAYLPLTVFSIAVIVFKIRVTSPKLNSLIFVFQAITVPAQMMVLQTKLYTINHFRIPIKLLFTFFSVWNLDFFRLMYPPFCFKPNMKPIHVLLLDYGIAVYPLILTACTYLLVEMHHNGWRVVVYIWRPFHYCFFHFKKQWNIYSSLIDAFATFMLLSYIKFMWVSFSILAYTPLYTLGDNKSNHGNYLYFDPSIEFFGREHAPYAVLAITVIIVFNILPALLLFLYPFSWCQKCINYCRCSFAGFHAFMDAFQGSFKNGTDGTYDCRSFAVIYLLVRGLLLATYNYTLSAFTYPVAISILIATAALVAMIQPWKKYIHNGIDVFLILCLASIYTAFFAIIMCDVQTFRSVKKANVMLVLSAAMLLIYTAALFFYWLLAGRKWSHKLWDRFKNLYKQKSEETSPLLTVESFPHRAACPQSQEYNSNSPQYHRFGTNSSNSYSSVHIGVP